MLKSNPDGRSRVVIESVRPEVDAGQFPVKRVVGERVVVEADIFTDGHDEVAAVLCYRSLDSDAPTNPGERTPWQETPMQMLVNDRWRGEFTVDREGTAVYTIKAWIDRFFTWHHDLKKRALAHQVTAVDLAIGAELIEDAASQASGSDRKDLEKWALRLRTEEALLHAEEICEAEDLEDLMQRNARRDFVTTYQRELRVTVDRKRAGFSAWYEMFPRSAADRPHQHGTLKDVLARLPYVAEMGFDVLYLPPIHPIGRAFRKGKNNATKSFPDDVGSPWGIGAEEGGHKAIHPQLGTMQVFRDLVGTAREMGIEVALDVAFQCAPDHPYVKEHPQWFRKRPDGTIQYAENPPKKYQDIYPFDFETEDWQALWAELKSIFDFWIERDVKIFRVDNPHTKPFAFWEWCIGEIKREHPDVLFLSEAFTRPKIMYRLAKLGFTQSYTYFAWRNTKAELTEYLTELTQTPVREFFRPNFWPNTPDILTEYLQVGGRPAFMARLVLAATLCSNYGIYGPPFEHSWTAPREEGSEEYLYSEKYQIHYHNLDRPDSLRKYMARVNQIRTEYAVLHTNHNLRFHRVDNEELICYSKVSDDKTQIILVVVNLDPNYTQSGFVDLPLDELELGAVHPYEVQDLLTDERYLWHGRRNYVELAPHLVPAHIFLLRRRVRTEREFETYL